MARGVVYVLFDRATLYVGNALALRDSGLAGCPARLCEHLRALLLPASRDGTKVAYKLFRALGLRGIYWLPVVLCATEQAAYNTESVAIAMENPRANAANLEQERSLLSRPAPAKRKRRNLGAVHRPRFEKTDGERAWGGEGF